MSTNNPASPALLQRLPVWDLPVRLFHWTVVILVTISWITGQIGGVAMIYHQWSGYAVLTLVVFRLLWGFWGGTQARFGDFVRGPRAALRYILGLLKGETAHYYGHNPVGGWMVILLLALLLIQAGSGLFANDNIFIEGPLYPWISKAASDFLTRIHRLNSDVLLIAIGLHVAAALFYLLVKGENLIWPLVTGYKWLPPTLPNRENRSASLWLAALLLGATAGGVYLLVR